MATIQKRGDRQWQAKIRKKGYPSQAKTFSTKAEAQKWSRLIESEMDRGIFISTSEAEQTTLAELFERYNKEVLPTKKGIRRVQSSMNTINSYIGHYSIATITPKVLAALRDERLKSVSGSTVRKDLLLINRVLKHAQKEWEIYLPMGNPVESIKVPPESKGRDRRLEQGEEVRLLNAANEYEGEILQIIQFAIETGMRRTEIHNLQWNGINLKKRTATLLDTKNGDDRTVPLSTKAVSIIKSFPRHINGRVFTMMPDSITQAFERVCKLAEIEGLRFHDLRHEATSRFFEMGLSIMEVSAITGHKDLSMLKRYTHLKAEDLALKLV